MIQFIKKCTDYYKDARLLWNRANNKYPFGVAYCSSYKDVKCAIFFARKNNLELRIRSGGHNYKGFSSINNGLVIDLSNLNNININYKNKLIKVGGGVLQGQVYNLLSSKDFPFVGGSCSTVGAIGYATGGGWGYSCRNFGLGCDNIIEAEIIDFKGKLIIANKDKNSDLFWALKGAGGGNFGVIVSLTFKFPNKVDNVTIVNMDFIHPDKNTQLEFINVWQDWIKTVTPKINLRASIGNYFDNEIFINCLGLYYGNEKDIFKLLEPFSHIQGFTFSTSSTSFLQAIQKISSTYPQFEYFDSYGGFINKNFSKKTINNLLDIINQERPLGCKNTNLIFYGLGGKTKEIPIDETAFYYRDSNFIMMIQSSFKNNFYKKENVEFILKHSKTLQPLLDGYYINFPSLPLDNYLFKYYGMHEYKLKSIKEKYDPLNIFKFPQGIN